MVLVFKLHIFSRYSLVAFDSYQSEKVRNTRIVNLTVTTIWVRFNVTCFARVYEIFTAVVSELQRGPHVVFQSLFRHTYYRCCVFFVFFNTDKKKQI